MSFSEQFTQDLTNKFAPAGRRFEVDQGRVYDRIVEVDEHGRRSAHAFVVRKTGDLVKCGGWKAPQKSASGELAVRYHLGDPDGYTAAVQDADLFGRYLYSR